MREQIEEILNASTEMMNAIVDEGKVLPVAAKLSKSYFDELLKIGFAENQAIQIVANYKV